MCESDFSSFHYLKTRRTNPSLEHLVELDLLSVRSAYVEVADPVLPQRETDGGGFKRLDAGLLEVGEGLRRIPHVQRDVVDHAVLQRGGGLCVKTGQLVQLDHEVANSHHEDLRGAIWPGDFLVKHFGETKAAVELTACVDVMGGDAEVGPAADVLLAAGGVEVEALVQLYLLPLRAAKEHIAHALLPQAEIHRPIRR